MLTTYSADGTEVRAHDEGQGPPVILVGPGLGDGRRGVKLSRILARRFRVLRPHRRQYRPDLKTDAPCSVAQEVEDIEALSRALGTPCVLYGHSSGGVVALEALVSSPESFLGAVIFEPPSRVGTSLTGQDGAVLQQARTAAAAGRFGQALSIFTRDVVGLPAWQAWPAATRGAFVRRYRELICCQLDDLEAIDRLGVRLESYAQIEVPIVLLGGERSPGHLLGRLDALERVMPHAQQVRVRGQDHGADVKAPTKVAQVIEVLADEVLPRRG